MLVKYTVAVVSAYHDDFKLYTEITLAFMRHGH